MSYTQVFGGTTIYPSDVSLLAITLNADKALEWPLESNDPSNPAARIIDVTTTGSYAITLPDATQTGAGQTILFNNLSASSNSFLLKDAGGSTIATVGVGEQWQVYLSGTATAAGTWRVFRYGASTATVQASALRGDGLVVSGNTLAQSMPVVTFASGPRDVLLSDRASALVWNGTGAGVLNLPTAVGAGNNFFIGVRNSGGGDLTVDASGSELVDGLSSLSLRPGDSTNLITDGLQWYTLGLGQQAIFAFDFTIINGLTGGSYTLAGSELNRIAYRFEGTLASNQDIVVPSTVQQYWVDNATTGAFNLYLRTSGGTRVAVTQGGTGIYYCNGSNVVDADTSAISLPISAAQGGTGLTSYAVGDMLYADGTTSLTKLSAVVAGNALISGGTGAAPAWGKIGLTTHVSGTLPVGNGGTGVASLTAGYLVKGNGTSAASASVVYDDGTNVGINTTTPSSKFAVFGGASGTDTRITVGNAASAFQLGVGSANETLLVGNAAVPMAFYTNSVERMRIDSAGNVLVGSAATPAGSGTNFQVANAASARVWLTSTGFRSFYLESGAGNALQFVDGTAAAERMRIDNAGNIVIGATSGAFKLDVPTNAVHFLETLVGNDTLGWSRIVTAAGATFIQAGSLNNGSAVAQPIVFGNMYGAGIERLRILATGGITSPDLADAVGYKGMPQNSQTASYTLALSDMGKHISITTGGVVIPANSGTAFPIGSTIVVYNDSGSAQNISITTDTLRLAGTATTGTRSLAQRGLATCVKVKATEWVVSGNVT